MPVTTVANEKKKVKLERRSFGNIYARNEHLYEARYFYNGEKHTFSTTTYDEADARLNEIEAQISLNKYAVGSKILLKDWIEHWLETYCLGTIRSSTYSSYCAIAKNHVYDTIGGISLEKLSVDNLQTFFNEKKNSGRKDGKEGGLSKKTLNNIRIMLNESLSQAIVDGKIQYNPISGVKLGKIPKPKLRALSKVEQLALERTVEASLKTTAIGICVDIYTGLRLGELLGLRWHNVHLDDDCPYIYVESQLTRQPADSPMDEGATLVRAAKDAKTRLVLGPLKTENAYRRIYLPDFVADYFRRLQAWERQQRIEFGRDYNPLGFVFTTEQGDVFDPRTYQDVFKKMLRAAGVQDINFHCLRHTYATNCVQNGVDATTLSQLLGHAKPSTSLDMYTHSNDDEKKKAANIFARK